MDQLKRIESEAYLIYQKIILPDWPDSEQRMPDTLYGYIMGIFSRIDLFSAHWRGEDRVDQSERMVSFMTKYMNPDRTANSVALHMWRHKLMHTASPRKLVDQDNGLTYNWLLHWGDEHLPRDQHFKFQASRILNLSLFGLIEDTRSGLNKYLEEISSDSDLQNKFDKFSHELNVQKYKRH